MVRAVVRCVVQVKRLPQRYGVTTHTKYVRSHTTLPRVRGVCRVWLLWYVAVHTLLVVVVVVVVVVSRERES